MQCCWLQVFAFYTVVYTNISMNHYTLELFGLRSEEKYIYIKVNNEWKVYNTLIRYVFTKCTSHLGSGVSQQTLIFFLYTLSRDCLCRAPSCFARIIIILPFIAWFNCSRLFLDAWIANDTFSLLASTNFCFLSRNPRVSLLDFSTKYPVPNSTSNLLGSRIFPGMYLVLEGNQSERV